MNYIHSSNSGWVLYLMHLSVKEKLQSYQGSGRLQRKKRYTKSIRPVKETWPPTRTENLGEVSKGHGTWLSQR